MTSFLFERLAEPVLPGNALDRPLVLGSIEYPLSFFLAVFLHHRRHDLMTFCVKRHGSYLRHVFFFKQLRLLFRPCYLCVKVLAEIFIDNRLRVE